MPAECGTDRGTKGSPKQARLLITYEDSVPKLKDALVGGRTFSTLEGRSIGGQYGPQGNSVMDRL